MKNHTRLLVHTAMLAWSIALASAARAAESQTVYIGTYTGKGSEGIYAVRMDAATGRLTVPTLAARADNPSFLALHPSKPFLYAVSEIGRFEGKAGGAVAAYAIDPATGGLTELNREPTGGAAPCHLAVDPTGRWLVVANYSDGNAAVFPIRADGRLGPLAQTVQHEGKGPNAKRQDKPHAHGVTFDASGKFVFVPDLGIDRVMIYRFDPAEGRLAPHTPPEGVLDPGAGPRHFVLHPRSGFGYAVNELHSSVTVFAWDATAGRLKPLQTAGMLPDDFKGANTAAEIALDPTGRFLYASNRGHNSIAVFALDAEGARLTPVQHQPSGGRSPRNFALDPAGRFLLAAHQDSGNVCVFTIDPATGRLTPTGHECAVSSAVCIVFGR